MKVLSLYRSVVLATILMPAGISAQNASVLGGRVLDMQTEEALVGARVELLAEGGRRLADAATDSAGSFAFDGISGAAYMLRVTASGYFDVTTQAMDVVADDTADVIVWMSVSAIPIAPLEVVVSARKIARHSGLDAFHRRSELQMGGRYMSAEDVSRRNPSQVSDLMRTMGAMTVVQETIWNSRAGCSPEVWIDGMRMAGPAFEAVNTVNPASIEGLEVYSGAATVPAEFAGSRARCGVIAIWLKRG